MRRATAVLRAAALSALVATAAAGPAAAFDIAVGAIRVEREATLPISRLDLPAENQGFAGARVALEDNNTTGRFLKQTYSLTESTVAPEAAAEEAKRLIGEGVRLLIVDAEAAPLLAVADAAAEAGAIVLNASSRDDALRGADCRANMLHVAPSRAMLADGLTQYLIWKRWDEWVLISGSNPADLLAAEAYRRSARKFGAKIEDEKTYEDTGGARRSDTGHVLVQRQMPVFTQDMDDHDVIVAADESNVFGVYLPYRTWTPRPVAGAAGLVPVTWHPAHEAYGATQMQRRFEKLNLRWMTETDYQVWLAMRAIGEAVSRTNTADPAALLAYMRSADFELAGFKGQPLSFRPWNNQLRQPIMLADGKLVVSISPQEGFLHRHQLLDTLGLDEPESECRF